MDQAKIGLRRFGRGILAEVFAHNRGMLGSIPGSGKGIYSKGSSISLEKGLFFWLFLLIIPPSEPPPISAIVV